MKEEEKIHLISINCRLTTYERNNKSRINWNVSMANATVCARASPFVLLHRTPSILQMETATTNAWSTGLHSTLLLFYHHYVLRVFIPTDSFCSFRSCSRSLFVYSFHQIRFQGHRSEIKQSERTNERKKSMLALHRSEHDRARKKSEVSEEREKNE